MPKSGKDVDQPGKLRAFASWGKIRSLGELQILTRASYLALIIVPLIAGLWPAVRVSINRYNVAAISAKDALADSHEKIDTQLSTLEEVAKHPLLDESDSSNIRTAAKSLREEAQRLRQSVDELADKFNPKKLVFPKLPPIWVYGYLSALCIVLAHTIYQANAPDIIKLHTQADFIDKAREERTRTRAEPVDIDGVRSR